MNTRNRRRPVALSMLSLAMVAASFAGPAMAAEEAIVASLSQPQPGLACSDAAARTSVYFQFAHPTFAVSQISLYLDGKGVPEEAIDQRWPTVTLTQGLHVGRNTVDIVAEGSGGQRLSRRLVVLVGPSAGGDTAAPATVPCDDSVAAGGEVYEGSPDTYEEPQPVIVENQPPVIVEQPPVIYQQPPVIYESAPVYVYRPYPVFALDAFVPLVPFFGFSFFYSNYHPYCPPPRVIYRPVPGYGWRGDDRGHWHDGDRGHDRDGDWHGRGGDRGGWQGDGRDGGRGHDRGRGDNARPGGWNGAPDRGQDRRPHDPIALRPAIVESHTTIETGGDHHGGPRGPQGPDNQHGRNIPGPDGPRGTPYRPMAPAPGWHPQQPSAPNRNFELHTGEQATQGGPPNVIRNNNAPQRQPMPHGEGNGGGRAAPGPQAQPGGHGGGQAGDRGGNRGGDRGGEHRHDNR